MIDRRFRRELCFALRSITRRLPTLYGFNAYLRWQRRWTPVDEEYCVTDVDETITMYLRPSEFVDFALFYEAHRYEQSERQVLWSHLKQGATFIDVGAHIGFYTLLAAKRVGRQGRVFAFEPDPVTYARLIRNVKANPELASRIHLFERAASDSEGVAQLYRSTAWNMGGNTLAEAEGAPATSVETTTLDHIFLQEAFDPRCTVVKIDVEGHEIKVLRGFHKTLSRKDKPILVVEAADQHLRRAGASSEHLVKELKSLGYQLFEIRHPQPRPLDDTRLPSFANLLALPSQCLIGTYRDCG